MAFCVKDAITLSPSLLYNLRLQYSERQDSGHFIQPFESVVNDTFRSAKVLLADTRET